MGADDTPPQTPGDVPAAIHRPALLSHAAALVACEAASKKSAEIGVPMNIAIVDASLVSRLPPYRACFVSRRTMGCRETFTAWTG
jgi:hypothetical protein